MIVPNPQAKTLSTAKYSKHLRFLPLEGFNFCRRAQDKINVLKIFYHVYDLFSLTKKSSRKDLGWLTIILLFKRFNLLCIFGLLLVISREISARNEAINGKISRFGGD